MNNKHFEDICSYVFQFYPNGNIPKKPHLKIAKNALKEAIRRIGDINNRELLLKVLRLYRLLIDIQSEISAITNDTTGPYWNNKHPDHAKMVQQVYTLREMAQPKED